MIDPLAMTVGADPTAVNVTLETIRGIRDQYDLNMSLGASNISFGLPARHALNAAFIPLAAAAGLTSAIMDARTPQIVEAARAAGHRCSARTSGAATGSATTAGGGGRRGAGT